MFDTYDVDEAKRMLPIYKRAVDLLEIVSGKKTEQAEQEHSADTGNMVFSKPSVFDGICCGCSKKAADGWALYCVECWEKAEQRSDSERMEPVAWAISHSLGLEFSSNYPMQKTKKAAEQMARQHIGSVVVTPLYAAPVRTKDLTDDEIAGIGSELAAKNCVSDISFARAVIAADREKNK